MGSKYCKEKEKEKNRKRGRLNTDGIDKQQKDQKSCGHNPIRISHEEEKGKKSGENNDAYNNMNEELQKKNRDDITEKMKHQQRSNKKKLKTDKKIISKQMTSSRGFILSTKTSQDAVTSSHLNKTKTQKKKHKKEETSLKSTKLSVEKTHQLTRKFKRKRKFLLFRTRDSGKALKTHQQSDKHTKTKVHSKKRKHVDLVVPSTGLTNPLPDKQLSRGDTEQQKSRTNAQQQQLSVVNDVQQSNYQPKCNERMKPKRKKIRSKLKNIRKDNRPDHLKPPHLRVITETRFPVLGIKD
ncbi:uncharacterized protein LOC100368920 [Saccoglossus kowalevskii]|uniref:Protein FAM133-like n=1 Tax=Saccoglossus kowalevskii TaxID=10224 RepID=A0ABM0GJ10_SACKO|nr:PREDICTED: protein FAM133-like [Saccoglossus kowalevskii]